jgi:hypothetical protein
MFNGHTRPLKLKTNSTSLIFFFLKWNIEQTHNIQVNIIKHSTPRWQNTDIQKSSCVIILYITDKHERKIKYILKSLIYLDKKRKKMWFIEKNNLNITHLRGMSKGKVESEDIMDLLYFSGWTHLVYLNN